MLFHGRNLCLLKRRKITKTTHLNKVLMNLDFRHAAVHPLLLEKKHEQLEYLLMYAPLNPAYLFPAWLRLTALSKYHQSYLSVHQPLVSLGSRYCIISSNSRYILYTQMDSQAGNNTCVNVANAVRYRSCLPFISSFKFPAGCKHLLCGYPS